MEYIFNTRTEKPPYIQQFFYWKGEEDKQKLKEAPSPQEAYLSRVEIRDQFGYLVKDWLRMAIVKEEDSCYCHGRDVGYEDECVELICREIQVIFLQPLS